VKEIYSEFDEDKKTASKGEMEGLLQAIDQADQGVEETVQGIKLSLLNLLKMGKIRDRRYPPDVVRQLLKAGQSR